MTGFRFNLSYFAFLLHRLSGLALVCFLPFHFLVLGLGLEGEAALNQMLVFTEQPLVKFGEWVLVVLFSLHLLLGLRVLVIEWAPWPHHGGLRSSWVIIAGGLALALGWLFLDGVLS
jgi:fumarate reductase subunit D